MDKRSGAGLCLALVLFVNVGGWLLLRQTAPAVEVVVVPAASCSPSPTPRPSKSLVPPVPQLVEVQPYRRIYVSEQETFSPQRPHGPPDWLAPHRRRESGERLAEREHLEEEQCKNLVFYSQEPPPGGVVLLWPENSSFRELLRTSSMEGVLVFDESESLVGRVTAESLVAKRPGLPDLFDLEVELQCGKAEARELYRSVTYEPYPLFVAEFHFGFSVQHEPDDDHDNLERSVSDLHISIGRRRTPLQHITHVVTPLAEGEVLDDDVLESLRIAYDAAWLAGVRVKLVATVDEEEARALRYPLEEPSVLFRCDCGEGDDMPHIYLSHALDTAWREGNSEYVLITSRSVALRRNAYVDLWEEHSEGSATLLDHDLPTGSLGEHVSDHSMYLPFSWARQLNVRGKDACSVPLQMSRLGLAKRRQLGLTVYRGSSRPQLQEPTIEELYCEDDENRPPWNTNLHVDGRRAAFFAEEHLQQSRQTLYGAELKAVVPEKFHRLIKAKEWEAGKGEPAMWRTAVVSDRMFPTSINRLVAVLSNSPEEGQVLVEIVLGLSGLGTVVAAKQSDDQYRAAVLEAIGQPAFASFSSRFDRLVRPMAQRWKTEGARHMVEPSHMFSTAMSDIYKSAFGKPPYHLEVVRIHRSVIDSIEALIACQAEKQGRPKSRHYQAEPLCYYSLASVLNPPALAIALVPKSDERFAELYSWMGGVVGFVLNSIALADSYEAAAVAEDSMSVNSIWYPDLLAESEAVRVLVNDVFGVRFYSPLATGHPPARREPPLQSRERIVNQVARFIKAYQDHSLWLPKPHALDDEMHQILDDPEGFFVDVPPPPPSEQTESYL